MILGMWRSKLNKFLQQSEKYLGQDLNLGPWLYAPTLYHSGTQVVSSLTKIHSFVGITQYAIWQFKR